MKKSILCYHIDMQNYSDILNIAEKEISLLKQEMIAGIDVDEKVLEFLNSPSKHIRPLLSFLYLKALGLDIEDAQIVYQSAIELVHNASLIHDDVIDESDTRRGKNSLNKDLGNKLAVISGNFLLSKALEKIISINSIELIDLFCRTLKNMTLGEINQYKLRYEIPDLEDYLKKTEYKTADLFVLSLKGSLKIAKSEENCDFAKNFGMAFQIRDDLINAKTLKTDFDGGIYTAPVIFSGGVEISQNGLEKTRDLLNNYVEKAEKSIEFLKESIYKEALLNLVRGLQNE